MKRILFISLFCGLFSFSKSQGFYDTIQIGSSTYHMMIHLPSDYYSTSDHYPLLLFNTGAGEVGSNPANAYKNGPNWAIYDGWDGEQVYNSINYKFIAITWQNSGVTLPVANFNRVVDSILFNYRVDTMRMYATGLSLGAQLWLNMFVDQTQPNLYKNRRFNAAVLYSAGSNIGSGSVADSLRWYAQLGGHMYYSIGASDGPASRTLVPTVINPMNSQVAGSAYGFYYTTPSGSGHCCWNTFYNPSWLDTTYGINIYEWLLQFTKYPSASAQDTITTSSSSVDLNGVTSGWDKRILWTQTSGPSATISTPNSDTTSITGLVDGNTYEFNLRVTNGSGPTFVDYQVVVNVVSDLDMFIMKPALRKFKFF